MGNEYWKMQGQKAINKQLRKQNRNIVNIKQKHFHQ